ncbi:MAG TPA: hypothetical protein VGA84_15140 [Thermoanaerobaculia bacterium]
MIAGNGGVAAKCVLQVTVVPATSQVHPPSCPGAVMFIEPAGKGIVTTASVGSFVRQQTGKTKTLSRSAAPGSTSSDDGWDERK